MASTVSKDEMELIVKIAKRAKNCITGYPDDFITILMDVEFAHRDCPMRLDELLNAPLSDFIHDICGIRSSINRKTKKLDGNFCPRFAVQQ